MTNRKVSKIVRAMNCLKIGKKIRTSALRELITCLLRRIVAANLTFHTIIIKKSILLCGAMLESCFCFAFSMMVPKPQVEKIVGKKKLASTV